MWRKDGFSWGFSFALGAVVLAGLVYLGWQVLRAVLEIAMPFVAGIVIALLLDPVVDRIQERWASGRRLPAVVLVFVGFLAVFVGLLAFVIPSLITQTQSLVTWFTPMTYAVQRSLSRDGKYVALASGLVGTEYVDHEVTNGTTYFYKVIASDRNGQVRRIGDPIQVTLGGETTDRDSSQASGPSVITTTTETIAPSPSVSPSAEHVRTTEPSPEAGGEAPPHPTHTEATPIPIPAPSLPSPVMTPDLSPRTRRPLELKTPPPPEGNSPDDSSSPSPSPQPSESPSTVGWLFQGDGSARAADPTPTPAATPGREGVVGSRITKRVVTTVTRRPSPTPALKPKARGSLFSGSGYDASSVEPLDAPTPQASTPLVSMPGDGAVLLRWKAPTKDVSGVDSIRVQVDQWLAAHRKIGPFALPPSFEAITAQYSDQLTQAVKISANRIGEIVLASASRLLSIILIPIVTFYVLADIDRLRGRLVYLLPSRARSLILTSAADISAVFGSYVRGMLLVSLTYGLVAMVLFVGFLKSYALLLGVAAGILYAVPYLGPLVTALIAATLSLITGHSMGGTTIILALVLAENQIFDNVVVPRVIGKSVGLHPLLTLFALLLGGVLFGLWGMLFSVPVAASIQQILFRLYPKLTAPTPLAMMMAGGEDAERDGEGTPRGDPGPGEGSA